MAPDDGGYLPCPLSRHGGNANMAPGGGWELIRLKESSWFGGYVYNGPYRMEAENAGLTGFQVTADNSASEDKIVVSNFPLCGIASLLQEIRVPVT